MFAVIFFSIMFHQNILTDNLSGAKRAVSAIVILAMGGFAALPIFYNAPAALAATTVIQEGANIIPASPTGFGSASFDQSLKNLAATGANYVTLDIPLYQTNVDTTDVQAGGDAPTAASLTSAIQYAHSLGMHVMLKFDIYPGDGQWSAYINPSDRTAWFSAYQNAITPFVQIAQQNNVEEICLGDELIDMSTAASNSTNTANWLSLIKAVRGIYSGKLTYDANWGGSSFADEIDGVEFWSALDYIGISAYFNLSGDGSVSSLMSDWASIDSNEIQPLEEKWGKPILFTEVGYTSIYDSYTHPWMWWESGTPDEAQQANDYQALFEYWDQIPYFAGFQLWNWSSDPNVGGPNDDGYTPQGKTAQTVMTQTFNNVSQPVAPAFAATASSNPSAPTVGSSAAFTANVTNSGGAVSGVNVDVEIHNAAGSQVYQKIFSGQNFSASSAQSYNFSWAPPSAGSYTLDVGVFSSDWSQEYVWDNQVLAFSAGTTSSSGSNSTGTVSIDVWWPTNGTTITGVQPFKAMVDDMSVDDYSMYWQVDGGQLNPMPSNDDVYPHKEASVDVSPWNWRSGTGPYTVTFVAENQSGQVIGKTSVQIYN